MKYNEGDRVRFIGDPHDPYLGALVNLMEVGRIDSEPKPSSTLPYYVKLESNGMCVWIKEEDLELADKPSHILEGVKVDTEIDLKTKDIEPIEEVKDETEMTKYQEDIYELCIEKRNLEALKNRIESAANDYMKQYPEMSNINADQIRKVESDIEYINTRIGRKIYVSGIKDIPKILLRKHGVIK